MSEPSPAEYLPGELVLSGTWGDTMWEFYTSEALPDAAYCTAVACVALRGSDMEVVLTCDGNRPMTDKRRGKWEIPGGHIDPLDPNEPHGPLESPETAMLREAMEECGARLGQLHPLGYRRIVNTPSADTTNARKQYPDVSYMAYYWSFVEETLQTPTDPNRPANGTFLLSALESLQQFGAMDQTELDIVRFGIAAAQQSQPQGNI